MSAQFGKQGIAGRLVRDIERKIEGQPDLVQAFEPKLERIKQFLAQKPNDKNKIYALHAPEVECIAKGKARTRYEFGVKVSIAVTNARANDGQFVVGIRAVPGLPYDGHTLKDQIASGRAADRRGEPSTNVSATSARLLVLAPAPPRLTYNRIISTPRPHATSLTTHPLE